MTSRVRIMEAVALGGGCRATFRPGAKLVEQDAAAARHELGPLMLRGVRRPGRGGQ